MPIIPVLTPEGDYSPPRMATPDINSLQNSYNARTGAGVGQIADAALDILNKKADIAGQIEAQQARVRYAMEVEGLKKQVETAPLQPRAGSGADFGVPEDANNQIQDGQLGLKPRSETMMKDFTDGMSKIDQKYSKGMSTIGSRYFAIYQARIQQYAGKVMVDAQSNQWEQEQIAGISKSVAAIHADMYSLPPQGPANRDESGNIIGGVPSYDPAKNGSFTTHLQLIDDTFNHALSLGMKADVVEKMRQREVQKFWNDAAEKEMHADPANWSASTKARTNVFAQHTDATHMDRLESKADSAIQKTQSQSEKDRKLAADGVMQELAAASQDHNTATMREKLRDPINRRLLTGEEQNTWYSRVLEMESGKIFAGNPAVEAEARIRAGDRNAGTSTVSWLNTQYQNEVNRPGTGISYQVYQDLTGRVNQHTEQRETRGDRFANEEYHREREVGIQLLSPIPDFKMIDNPAIKATIADFSDEFARRVPIGSSVGTAAKTRSEILPKYLGRMGANLQPHLDAAQKELPTPIKLNPATMEPDQVSMQEARAAAWQLSGVKSVAEAQAAERNNAVKPETKARLKAIDDVETWAGYIKGLRYNANEVKK